MYLTTMTFVHIATFRFTWLSHLHRKHLELTVLEGGCPFSHLFNICHARKAWSISDWCL